MCGLFLFMGLLFSFTVLAAGGDPHTIPWTELILGQSINVILTVVLLVYLTRKPVKSYFIERRKTYFASKEKAEKTRREIQIRKQDLEVKIKEIDTQKVARISEAQEQAIQKGKDLVAQAEQTASKTLGEAQQIVELETNRISHEIKKLLLSAALEKSQTDLSGNIDSTTQKKLNSEFIQKLAVK